MLNTSELRPRRKLGEGAHGGGKNVFEMALSGMDQMMIGWMMVAVVFSQLVLDEVLRRAEASVGTNARACLREVYKELSTLGLISFTLFMVQSFETQVNEATLLAFEYSHIFVFSFAIVYVIQSAVVIACINPIKRRLIRLHAYGDAVVAAVAATVPQPSQYPPTGDRNSDLSVLDRLYALICCAFGGASGASPTLSRSKEAVRAFDGFRAFRRKFLRKHSLPACFLFDHYLIEVYDRWVILKLDIATWCWALMCVIFGIHALVARFPHFAAFCLNRWTFLCYGWLLLLADYTLFILVHRVHERVLKQVRSSNSDSLSVSTTSSTCSIANGSMRSSSAASVDAAGGSGGSVGQMGEEDVMEELRQRRAALHAQYFREQKEKDGAHEIIDAGIGENGNEHADVGVLRHPPRHWHWGVANLLNAGGITNNTPTNNVVADGALGFTLWESFAFNYGTEALSIIRCLYLAAWPCTYTVPAFGEWFSTGWALLYILVIPIPAIITGTVLIPRMATRFLLVGSLSVLNLEAFDAVVEYMEDAEAALKDIAHLLQRLTNINDTGASSVEQLFASLAQHHRHHRLSPSDLTHATNARVARALSQTNPPESSSFITYAELRDFLRHHGVHLPLRRFRALVRFIDLDLGGHVNLEDFRALLRADHLFEAQRPHQCPSSARVARLLSQDTLNYHPQNSLHGQDAVFADVGQLLRRGSRAFLSRVTRSMEQRDSSDRAGGVTAASGV
ncbi:hypothetical protein VYU27_008022 [Nannochloropsis oceanica]